MRVSGRGRARALCLMMGMVVACVDATPPADDRTAAAFRRLTAQLDSEHFRGSIYPALPRPGVLRLSVRDPYGRRAPKAPAESLATALAQRALALFVPPPAHPQAIEEVQVSLSITHRLGPFIWTTSLGTFHLPTSRLRALPSPAPDTGRAMLPFPLKGPPLRVHRDSSRAPRAGIR